MTERKPAKKGKRESSAGFTADERAAMREHVQELRAAKGRGTGAAGRADDERAVLEKIAAMPPDDRAICERLHAVIAASAPQLAPRLWYGMPAYARDGQVVCFVQNAGKFKARYTTLGFSDKALLDDGRMWPTSFALTELTAEEEARVAALVRRAAGRAAASG